MKKIIITGTGGQGVKYLAKKVAQKLIKKKFDVSLIVSYDAAMEGGDIYCQLVYSMGKIENPLIDKADILVELEKVKKEFEFKKKITAEEIQKKFPGIRLNEGGFEILVEELGL